MPISIDNIKTLQLPVSKKFIIFQTKYKLIGKNLKIKAVTLL